MTDDHLSSERRHLPPTPYSGRINPPPFEHHAARGPPTPPARTETDLHRFSTSHLPPLHSPGFPSPHDSRHSSVSSYAAQHSPVQHSHRLSTSSIATSSSARDRSPHEAPRYLAAPPAYHRQMPHPAEYGPISPPVSLADREPQWRYSGMAAQTSPTASSLPPPVTPTGIPPSQHQLADRYVCPSCAKAFSRPSSLRIHVHSHTGEKPFKCPHAGCGKAFSVRSNMRRHQRGCHMEGGGSPSGDADDMDLDE